MSSADPSKAVPEQIPDLAASGTGESPSANTDAAREVLITEYNVLMTALSAAWSASLTRTSLFLGVLSAAGVAFGFASQGGLDLAALLTVALVVLLLVLLLGVATFIRLVEVQRESMVYITGMNRIRRFFHDTVPGSRSYFVLPIDDDEPALYRSIGTGMNRQRPRFRLLHLTVQTQGIVGVFTAVVAAGCGALAAAPIGGTIAWLAGTSGFVVTASVLFVYWHRSLAEMRDVIQPMYPTPTERLSLNI